MKRHERHERHDILRDLPPCGTVEHEVYGPTGTTVQALPVWRPTPKGAALRAMRQAKGVTLRHAAEEAGLSAYDWSRIERGRVEPEDPSLWIVLRSAVVTAERYDREGGAPPEED